MNSAPILARAMTGDRPTGCLHVGHFVGSLRARLQLQHTHQLTVLVADCQALTDHAHKSDVVRRNITEVMKDYLAVGLDPSKVTFVLQSAVPELFEIGSYLQNLVTVSAIERNPTVRAEIKQKGMQRDIPLGFFCYPVAQAADIIGLGGGVVPVGEDQLPMIETTNMLIDRLNNRNAGSFERCAPRLSSIGRLVGVDGQHKMSKSMNNSIALGASFEELTQAVRSMYTDPLHVRVSDPGHVEGNVVFAYLDAFDPNVEEVAELKAHYQRGGLGDTVLKTRLLGVMEEVLAPIRAHRAQLNDADMHDILRHGSQQARTQAQQVAAQVRACFGVVSFPSVVNDVRKHIC